MDFNNYKGLNTLNSNNDSTEPKFSSSVVNTNEAGINIPVENNSIPNNSVGKNEESLDKKDGKKSKDKKNKKEKNKDKDKKEKNCLIW